MADAVRNPNSSLQTVVDDWIESYQSDAGPAMAELVNFVLRVRLPFLRSIRADPTTRSPAAATLRSTSTKPKTRTGS